MFCPIVYLTQQLIRCRSLSPKDDGCQELLIKRLKSIDFNIEQININDTSNFWATRGKGKTLVFAGHTDVVHPGNINDWNTPPFEPIINNGILFGRGAADMKGSLAAMIVAIERFIAMYPKHQGRLAFLITSDEESSAINGTIKVIQRLMSRKEKIDYCIIGEPTSTNIVGDTIKNGRRGSITANLVIHGIQGHVAYPYLANNPIHIAIPILNKLINKIWDNGNKFFSPSNLQITNIQAGTGMNNIIPGNLLIQFNLRFNTELTESMIKNYFLKLLNYSNLNYNIEWILSAKPFISLCGELTDTVINVIIDFNKLKPEILTNGGTSDGRFIINICSQIVELGLINTTIHKINECVKISDLQLLSAMYQSIIEKLICIKYQFNR